MIERATPLLAVIALLPVTGCGGNSSTTHHTGSGNPDFQSATPPDMSFVEPDDMAEPPCDSLNCRIVPCMNGNHTTLSGTVTIPAGKLPLYNVTVYVPNGRVEPITHGPSCDTCGQSLSGDPLVVGTTDVDGHFQLVDVPSGFDVPLVIQLGKWRRQITVPAVTACQDTVVGSDLTRLPRNKSEGDLPRIALTTGSADAIECLLRKIGISDGEFTPEAGKGSVNLFAGNGGTNAYALLNGGANFTVASDQPNTTSGWWSQPANWKLYDMVILSCEGDQHLEEKSNTARMALQDFVDKGGRVFASHWHNVWLAYGPMPLSTVGTFFDQRTSQAFSLPITSTIDTSFDDGKTFAQWLFDVGASPMKGQLEIDYARNTVNTIDKKLTRRYVYYDDPMRMVQDAQYFSFTAPVGAAPKDACGRMVFTDMHVSGGDGTDPNRDRSSPQLPFPMGCVTKTLSPQEKALLYLIFDLSGCVQTTAM